MIKSLSHPLDCVVSSGDNFDLEIEEISNPLASFDNCVSSAGSLSSAATSSGGSSSLSSAASVSTAACWSGGS